MQLVISIEARLQSYFQLSTLFFSKVLRYVYESNLQEAKSGLKKQMNRNKSVLDKQVSIIIITGLFKCGLKAELKHIFTIKI